jgi:hypothetical protein
LHFRAAAALRLGLRWLRRLGVFDEYASGGSRMKKGDRSREPGSRHLIHERQRFRSCIFEIFRDVVARKAEVVQPLAARFQISTNRSVRPEWLEEFDLSFTGAEQDPAKALIFEYSRPYCLESEYVPINSERFVCVPHSDANVVNPG